MPDRLITRMRRALQSPVVAVQAPAGYGKSAVVRAGLLDLETSVLWRPAEVRPDPEWYRRIASAGPETVLVVESFERLTGDVFDALMGHANTAVRGMGPRVLLTTRRALPPALLALRAQGHVAMVERVALTFTPAEALEAARDALGADVTPSQADTFYGLSRGWPAAYRFVALREPGPGGSAHKKVVRPHRSLDAYLDAEAFAEEPPALQEALLRLSVLDALTEASCRSVLEDTEEGRTVLSRVEDRGLFVEIGPDGLPRFHPLYAAFLRRQALAALGPDDLVRLHDLARSVCDSEGRVAEGVEHALAGSDPDSAVALLWRHHHELMEQERWAELGRLVARLPAPAATGSPEALLLRAWAGAPRFDLPALLAEVEAGLAARPDSLSRDEQRGELAVLKAHAAIHPIGGTTAESRQQLAELAAEALRLVPHHHRHLRGDAWMLAALAHHMADGRRRGHDVLAEGRCELEPGGGAPWRTLLATECFLAWKDGDLIRVEQVASRLLGMEDGEGLTRTSSIAHAMLGRVCYQRGALSQAESHLSVLGEDALADNVAMLLLTLEAAGRRQEVDDRLLRLRTSGEGSKNPARLATAHALAAEIAFRRGDREAAAAWADAVWHDSLDPMHCAFEALLTRTRIHVTRSDAPDRAEAALAAAHRAADLSRHRLAKAEVLALEAIHEAKRGNAVAAQKALRASLAIGRPAGAHRLYVDQGPEFLGLVARLLRDEADCPFLRRLIDEGGSLQESSPAASLLGSEAYDSGLSWRELDVLEKLALRQRNKDIAQTLGITVATVKKHATHIYGKLGVQSRREAVEQARRRNILRS